MEPESDAALVERAREGDDDAFAILVERYKDSLINYLTHLTRSRDRAEEIAQDSFLRFYRSAAKWRDQQRLAPYLFRIATNLTISQSRRERRWKSLLPYLVALEPRTAPPADGPLLTAEIQQRVAAALERLPIKFRAPLVLFEIEEWSCQEISRALGCRVGTVKSRIWRARALMRAELQSWWIGGSHERRRSWRSPAAAAANDGIAPLHV